MPTGRERRRRRFVVFLALVLLPAAPVDAQTDAIDDYVVEQMEVGNIPGIALVVIRDGEIVKTVGYGVADRALGTPVTPDTIFPVGSVSKQFIAAGIMLLVQDGRLTLDDSIARLQRQQRTAGRGGPDRHSAERRVSVDRR